MAVYSWEVVHFVQWLLAGKLGEQRGIFATLNEGRITKETDQMWNVRVRTRPALLHGYWLSTPPNCTYFDPSPPDGISKVITDCTAEVTSSHPPPQTLRTLF